MAHAHDRPAVVDEIRERSASGRLLGPTVGGLIGALYAILLTVAAAVSLGAGFNPFFQIVALSPPPLGALQWPVVGVLLGSSVTRRKLIVVLLALVAHELVLVALLAAEPAALTALPELARLFPVLAPAVLVTYAAGQLGVWWRVVQGWRRVA